MRKQSAEDVEELKQTLRRWQDIEQASIAQTGQIIQKTENPLIKLIMEIVRQDSTMHYRVQQAMLDSLEKEAFHLTPEELAAIWDLVEKHAEMEKETIELAEKARKNCHLFTQRHLLSYLVDDEKKHDKMLAQLEDFKRNIYPYA